MMAAVVGFLGVGLWHDTFFDGEVVFCLWFAVAASLAAATWGSPAEENN